MFKNEKKCNLIECFRSLLYFQNAMNWSLPLVKLLLYYFWIDLDLLLELFVLDIPGTIHSIDLLLYTYFDAKNSVNYKKKKSTNFFLEINCIYLMTFLQCERLWDSLFLLQNVVIYIDMVLRIYAQQIFSTLYYIQSPVPNWYT